MPHIVQQAHHDSLNRSAVTFQSMNSTFKYRIPMKGSITEFTDLQASQLSRNNISIVPNFNNLKSNSTTNHQDNQNIVIQSKRSKEIKSLSSKHLEQWMNEVLEMCEEMNLPGIITKIDAKLPLYRYQVDRLCLTNLGVSNDNVDRIYRSLFVYSIGFFELLNDCTQHLELEKVHTQTLIWRVFHILLEHCCQTDYQLITQKMETNHQEELAELYKTIEEMKIRLEKSEANQSDDVQMLQKLVNDLESDKHIQEQEKSKLMQESQKTSQKHEEEVQLRIQFESKLNSMHHMNRDATMKYKNMKIKCAEQSSLALDLRDKLTLLQTEHRNLVSTHERLKCDLSSSQNECNELQQVLQHTQTTLLNTENTLLTKEMKLSLLQDQLDCLIQSKDLSDIDREALKNFLSAKSNEHGNAKSYLEDVKLKLQGLEQQYSTSVLREKKAATKLSLFKGQILTFEAVKQDLVDKETQVRKELQAKSRLCISLEDDLEALREQHASADLRWQEYKTHYEHVLDKFRVQAKIKQELEQKLKYQMDQTQQLHSNHEEDSMAMKQLKREVYQKDVKYMETKNERDELQQELLTLEEKYETLKARFEDTSTTLKVMVENEKESRYSWKDRYEREQEEKTVLGKQNLALKYTVQDYSTKMSKIDIELKNIKDVQYSWETEKNSLKAKLTESLQQNERYERELSTKRRIIDDFEAKKKQEIKETKERVRVLEREYTYAQMLIEDLSSDMYRWNERHLKGLDQISELQDTITGLQTIMKMKKAQSSELLNEKIKLQQAKAALQLEHDIIVNENAILNQKVKTQINTIEHLNQLNLNLQRDLYQHQDVIDNLKGQVQSLELEIEQQKYKNTGSIDQEVQVSQHMIDQFCQVDDLILPQLLQKGSLVKRSLDFYPNGEPGLSREDSIHSGSKNKSSFPSKLSVQKSKGKADPSMNQSDMIVVEEYIPSSKELSGNTSVNLSRAKSRVGTAAVGTNEFANDIKVKITKREMQKKRVQSTLMQGPRSNQTKIKASDAVTDYRDNALNDSTGFANRSMLVDQTSRIDTSDSTKPSDKLSTFHRKKMSVGESIATSQGMHFNSQPRIKRLLKNAYSSRQPNEQ